MLPYLVQTTSRLSYTLQLEALGSLATLLLAINLIDVTFRKTIIMRSSQRIYLETLTFMEPCIARCVFYITNEMQLIQCFLNFLS